MSQGSCVYACNNTSINKFACKQVIEQLYYSHSLVSIIEDIHAVRQFLANISGTLASVKLKSNN